MNARPLKWLWRIVGTLSLVIIACGVWAVVIEPDRLVIRNHALTLEKWPSRLSGYRIVVLTDLHVGSPHIDLEKLQEIVAAANAQVPDLIVLAGDYVIDEVIGGTRIDITAIAPVLAGLRAKDGVFAVLGNHDNWNNGPRIAGVLTANGIAVLEDASQAVATSRGAFTLAGVSDYSTAPHDVARALDGAADPVIVLTHSPDVFPDLPQRVALGIAGHTHGGQVDLPILGRLVIPSRYGERYAQGVIVEGAMTFFIGSGIGTSIAPVRFGVPPEISVLTLDGVAE